jgi:LysM repeat protein
MFRPAVVPLVLGLLLVAPVSAAGSVQDAPRDVRQGEPAFHVVQAGETLTGIARDHYGSAAEWQRILEANRDRISDPRRLAVGTRLVLPGRAGVAAARVTGIRMEGREFPGDPQDRRALLQRRPFVPAGEPEPPVERTIFHEDRTLIREEQLTQVLVLPREEVPAIPSGVARAGGWTIPPGEPVGAWGMIREFAGGADVRIARSTLLPYDQVRVVLEAGVQVQPGDSLLVARINRNLPEVGHVVGPTGVVEVQRVEEGGAVGRMVGGLGKGALGDLVFPLRTFHMVPGVYPTETDRALAGTILAFQEVKELYQPGDFLFIDRGALDGLAAGDEFVVPGGAGGGWDGRRMAQLQVVWVGDERATLRILSTEFPSALRPGAAVLLDRAMR